MKLTPARRLLAAVAAAILAVLGVVVATPSSAADATITRVQVSKNFAYGSTNRTSGTAGTLPAPAAAGDLLVLAVTVDKAGGTIAWPSGFTNVQQRSGTSVTVGVATKVATGGETSAGTFTWATGRLGYAAMLVEYSGASGVDSSTLAPGTYSDTAVTSLSVDPPAATAGGLAVVFGGLDTSGSSTAFNPTSTGYTYATGVSDTTAVGTPGLSLTQRSAQHPAATNLPASTFTWSTSDQAQLIELNLAAKQVGVAPVASFTQSPSSGTAPLAVQFTDTSTGAPTSWSWNFGDSGTSTAQNPSHTYSAAGTYTVTLTATNANGNSTATNTVTVTASASPWTTVVDDQFNSGGVPSHWSLYDGPYGSDPFNCALPSQASVSNGAMHMLLSYFASTPTGGDCGAGWYSAGMMLSSDYAAIDQRITLRWRMTSTDPAYATNPGSAVISHNNMPMHFGDGNACWPTAAQGGEIDYMEGAVPNDMNTFIHYGSTCSASTQFQSSIYSADFRDWHTVRAERLDNTVKVYIDDMTTPVYTKVGDSTTIPDTLQRVVLQQECRASGCPATTSPTNGYSADVQVDWITVENYTP